MYIIMCIYIYYVSYILYSYLYCVYIVYSMSIYIYIYIQHDITCILWIVNHGSNSWDAHPRAGNGVLVDCLYVGYDTNLLHELPSGKPI